MALSSDAVIDGPTNRYTSLTYPIPSHTHRLLTHKNLEHLSISSHRNIQIIQLFNFFTMNTIGTSNNMPDNTPLGGKSNGVMDKDKAPDPSTKKRSVEDPNDMKLDENTDPDNTKTTPNDTTKENTKDNTKETQKNTYDNENNNTNTHPTPTPTKDNAQEAPVEPTEPDQTSPNGEATKTPGGDNEDPFGKDKDDGTTPGPMDLNDNIIETKANRKYFGILDQLPEERMEEATTPFATVVGTTTDCVQYNFSEMQTLVACLYFKTTTLDEPTAHTLAEKGLKKLVWMEIATILANNKDTSIYDYITLDDELNLKVFLSRLAHTKPNTLFTITKSTTTPNPYSYAWYGAMMTLGSYYLKQKPILTKKSGEKQSKMTSFMPGADKQANKKAKTDDTTGKDNPPLKKSSKSALKPGRMTTIDAMTAKKYDHRLNIKFSKLKPKKDEPAAEIALAKLRDMMTHMKNYDPSCVLGAWSMKNKSTEVIATPEQIHLKKLSETRGHAHKMRPCLLYTSPSPRDQRGSRMPSSA